MIPPAFDPALIMPQPDARDPDTGEALDCTRCGACCEAGEGSMLIEAEDLLKWRRQGRHDLADHTAEGHFSARAFPTTVTGTCVYLTKPDGKSLCSIYEDRATVCRAFQAGSWQCLEFRRDARQRSPEVVASTPGTLTDEVR